MSGSAPFKLNCSGVMLALLSTAFASQAGAAAGRAEFVIGTVTVAGRDAVERPLTRGTELDNGDVVRTNDGRAQIRFTDGAYVSLQPNTEFGIREYLFENKTDGSEKGFFGLLKGAMRTVTGAIGRVNRNRYQITTPTATVGIRGTGGVIQVLNDGSTLVIGTSGVWSLTNPAGSIDVPAGVSGLSPSDPNEPPRDTTQQPSSGPAPLPPQESVFTQGDERTLTGDPVVSSTIITPPPIALLLSGGGYAAAVGWEAFQVDAINSGDAVFNAAGEMTHLTSVEPPADIFFGEYELINGINGDFGTDGILAWGRWIGDAIVPCEGPCQVTYDTNKGLHYVIGMPTATMPTSGSATYTLLGATQPTYTDGSTLPGKFSGSLNVNFGSIATVDANFTVAMPGRTYGLSGRAGTSSAFFTISPAVTGCVSCSGFVTGFFAGPVAERAGVGYHINDGELFKDVLGAAAFTKQ